VDEPLDASLHYPLFVKPSREGTGMGVSGESIVGDDIALRAQLREQLERYRQPVLVERFVSGREVTVGCLGNLNLPVARQALQDGLASRVTRGLSFLPPLEVNFDAYPASEGGVYTNRMKTDWADDFRYVCPAPLAEDQVESLNRLTAAVFRVTGCRDVARVDFRLDASNGNAPYVLEVNPLPGLYPGRSDLVLEAEAAGTSYADLINAILNHACQRYGLAPG
jgi:D-alanine-D-alanine ligase